MKTLKHGDTDGVVQFTLHIGEVPTDLTDRSVAITLSSGLIRRVLTNIVRVEPFLTGRANWQPTAQDWAVLVPRLYKVEAIVTGAGGAQRAYPTYGYSSILVEPRL